MEFISGLKPRGFSQEIAKTLDGDALEAAIGAWLVSRVAARDDGRKQPRPPTAVAVDGTSLRGDGVVLAQREVGTKSN
jgi:hypothetical protein